MRLHSVAPGAGINFRMAGTRVNTPNPADRDIDALVDSERRFRLLVEGVIDYAIYMLDPDGIVDQLERRRASGSRATRPTRSSASISASSTPEDSAAGLPAAASQTALREGQIRGRRLARPQGRHALLRLGRDRSALRETATCRLRQDHPRHHRAARRRGARCWTASATSGCWSAASPTTRSTCSIPTGMCRAGTPAASASRATRRRRSSASISRASTPTGPGRRPPGAGADDRARDGRYEEEGWRVRKDGTFFWASVVIDPIRDDDGKLIGYAKITRDITERREAQMELEQGAAAARRIAEDGCARPAHRRRGARLQQPAHGGGGQHPDAEDDRRTGSEGRARGAGDRVRRPSAAPP